MPEPQELTVARSRVAAGLEALEDESVYIPESVSTVQAHLSAGRSAGYLGDPEEFRNTAVMSSDIIVLEAFGWNSAAERTYNSISNGHRRTYQSASDTARTLGREFDNGVLQAIFKSQRPITSADVPGDHPLTSSIELLLHNSAPPPHSTPQAWLDNRRQTLEDFAFGSRYCGRYMGTRFGPILDQVIDKRSALSSRGDITVSIIAGDGRETVIRALQEAASEGQEITRLYDPNSVMPPEAELVKAKLLGFEMSKATEERLILEELLRGAIRYVGTKAGIWQGKREQEILEACRAATGQFSDEELRTWHFSEGDMRVKENRNIIARIRTLLEISD